MRGEKIAFKLKCKTDTVSIDVVLRSTIFGGALCRDDSIDPKVDVPKGNVRSITSLDLSLLTMVICNRNIRSSNAI